MQVTYTGVEACLLKFVLTKLGALFVCICVLLIAVILFCISHFMFFYKKRREDFYRMLYCMGMSADDGFRVFLREMTIMFIKAGLMAGYFLLILYFLVGTALKSISFSITADPFFFAAALACIYAVLVIFFLIANRKK